MTGLRVALGALVVVLAGCGFELRRPTELPYQRLMLSGFAARSPMADAVQRELPAGARTVATPREAQVQIVALEDKLYRTVVASTPVGQVREIRLRVVLKYRFESPDGQALGADTNLEQSRDMSYSETAALGKELEEADLLREMRADIARQMLQRLAAVGRQPR